MQSRVQVSSAAQINKPWQECSVLSICQKVPSSLGQAPVCRVTHEVFLLV